MAEYFRWKNCYADVTSTFNNPRTVKAYLTDVVQPGLAAIDKQLATWNENEDPGSVFAAADIEVLLNATIEAFALAIQSLWERQLRGYLASCAAELQPDLMPEIQRGNWERLDALFQTLRGASLKDFAQFEQLDFLQLIGNAARHGEGRSMQTLRQTHPELWPGLGQQIPGPDGKPMQIVPTNFYLVLVRRQLDVFVDSIAGFWDTVEYVYQESLSRRHESLERRMPSLREEFAGKIRHNVEAGLAKRGA